MDKLLNLLEVGLDKLIGYKSGFREITEVIDEEIKEKTGRKIFSCSDKSRIYGTVKLIQLAKKSLVISINHRNYHESEVVNDSYIYSALYDAAVKGVSIDVIATYEAYEKLSRYILYVSEPFIADNDNFRSSVMVDGRIGKTVYTADGRTYFWFC